MVRRERGRERGPRAVLMDPSGSSMILDEDEEGEGVTSIVVVGLSRRGEGGGVVAVGDGSWVAVVVVEIGTGAAGVVVGARVDSGSGATLGSVATGGENEPVSTLPSSAGSTACGVGSLRGRETAVGSSWATEGGITEAVVRDMVDGGDGTEGEEKEGNKVRKGKGKQECELRLRRNRSQRGRTVRIPHSRARWTDWVRLEGAYGQEVSPRLPLFVGSCVLLRRPKRAPWSSRKRSKLLMAWHHLFVACGRPRRDTGGRS